MKLQHPHYHWLLVAMILIALSLTLTEVYGQSTDATATFQGRPAMAGAQAGQGAMAGPPTGGIGVQGSELAERSIRRYNASPSSLDDVRQAHRDGGDSVAAANKDTDLRQEVTPSRDRGIAKDQRSAVKKVKRAAKRTITRARHGTSQIDSYAAAGR